MRVIPVLVAAICLVSSAAGQSRKLLVVSIDGLDHRYLKDRDAMKLRTPNLRKLVDAGSLADGVVGIVPTVTWPSHTTLITGVRAEEHGILDNNITTAAGSERYWFVSYLKVPTLWHAAKKAGRTVAAVNWPVTVGADIDWNVPEYFQDRAGGGTDFKSVEEKATPGLMNAIAAQYPSFASKWMDDRTRAQAAVHILKHHQPDLMLVHFMDHDDAAHESGPFSREAIATLEHTDELLGQLLAVIPAGTVVAVVSDHGFEAAPRELNTTAFLAARKLPLSGTISRSGYLTTFDTKVAEAFAQARGQETCVGREIPRSEVERFLPDTAPAARLFEPAPGCAFVQGKPGEPLLATKPTDNGRHGHWPTRYRAAYLMWGPGVKTERLPEMDMRDAAGHFAKVLNLEWPPRR